MATSLTDTATGVSEEHSNSAAKKRIAFDKWIPHFHDFTNLQFTLCFVPPNKVIVCDRDGFYLINVQNGSRLGYHKWSGLEINESLKRFAYRPADNTIFMCYGSYDKYETYADLVGYDADDLDRSRSIEFPKQKWVVNKTKSGLLGLFKPKIFNSTTVVTVLNGSTLLLAVNAGQRGSALFSQRFKTNQWIELWYSKTALEPFFDVKHVYHNKQGDHAVYVMGVDIAYKFVLDRNDQSLKGFETIRVARDLCCLVTIQNGVFCVDNETRRLRELAADYDKGSLEFDTMPKTASDDSIVGYGASIYFNRQLIMLGYDRNKCAEKKLRIFDIK